MRWWRELAIDGTPLAPEPCSVSGTGTPTLWDCQEMTYSYNRATRFGRVIHVRTLSLFESRERCPTLRPLNACTVCVRPCPWRGQWEEAHVHLRDRAEQNPRPIVAFLEEVICVSRVKPAISGRKSRKSCQAFFFNIRYSAFIKTQIYSSRHI